MDGRNDRRTNRLIGLHFATQNVIVFLSCLSLTGNSGCCGCYFLCCRIRFWFVLLLLSLRLFLLLLQSSLPPLIAVFKWAYWSRAHDFVEKSQIWLQVVCRLFAVQLAPDCFQSIFDFSTIFSLFPLDGRANGWTDGRTDGRTDTGPHKEMRGRT